MISQSTFHSALLDAAQPVPDELLDGQGRPAGRRYAVYRNNVAVSLRDALATGFPAVAKLIGDDTFATAAGLYLRAHPPASPVMMRYGATFPEFLAGLEPLAHIGYLADIARLELALRHAYHAADAAPFEAARLQNLDEDALLAARFHLAPATRVQTSPWPLLSIYLFTMEPGHPKPQAKAQDVLIARPDMDPVLRVLPAGGAAFVNAIAKGDTFGAAIDAAGDDFDLPATLGLLLKTGALHDMTLPASHTKD